MRFDRVEQRREGEVAREAVLPRARTPAALVQQLQQGVGNAVIARTLQTADLLQRLKDAVASEDWMHAILALSRLDDHSARICIVAMSEEVRWSLLDALRTTEEFPERARLETLLRIAQKVRPGGLYGTVTVAETPVHASKDGGPWQYRIEIRFMPDAEAVDCPEIAFVQTTRMVEPDTNVSVEKQFPMSHRRNELGEAIDRPAGKNSGYYGYGNDDRPEPLAATAQPEFTVSPGSSPKPVKEAWMMDRVTDTSENVSYDFETLVVAKRGAQEGFVYASVHWGFDVDGKRHLTPHKYWLSDRPSAGFATAVQAYNEQAVGLRGPQPSESPKLLPDFF